MEAKLFIFAAVAISEVYSACEPANATFENFQRLRRRSIPFDVVVTAKSCPGLFDFYYQWTVARLPSKEIVQRANEAAILINGYDYDSNVCFTSVYVVTVEVSHYPDMSSSNQARDSFIFLPDSMHIEILGGLQIPFPVGRDLIVDAYTYSRDSSYPEDEDAFAGNEVKWTISPEIKGFTPSNSLVLKVPSSFLNLSMTYTFTVNVTRTKIVKFKDVQTATQTIIIVPADTPQLNVQCIRNCVLPNSKESTAFKVVCVSGCTNLTYEWLVTPRAVPGSFEFGNGYDIILIKPDTYRKGTTVVVTFFIRKIPVITSLKFVSKLKKGRCSINPNTGISGITKFKIRCRGFSSPHGLSLSMIYQKSIDDPYDIVLLDEYNFKEEDEIYLPAGKPVILSVLVEDQAFLQAEVVLRVVVERYRPVENIQIESNVKKIVLARDADSITTFSLEGFYGQVIQLVNSFLLTIRNIKMDKASTRDLHKHMVEAIKQMEPVRITSAIQRVLILCKIKRFAIQTDTVTSRLIAKVLLGNTLNVHFMYVHKKNLAVPLFSLRVIFEYTFQLCSELLQENSDTRAALNIETPPHEYDSYDDFMSEKVEIRDNYAHMVTNIIVTMQTVCLTSLSLAIPDESAQDYNTFMIRFETRRRLLKPLINKHFTLSFLGYTKIKVILPPELMKELHSKYTYIDYQFGVFKVNPFWWHKNISTFGTRPILFDLFIHCDKIRKLSRPFLIHLELTSVPSQQIVASLPTKKEIAIYKIEIEPGVTLVAEFYNEGKHPHEFLVTWSDCVCTEADFSSTKSKFINKNKANQDRTMRVETGKGAKNVYLCVKKKTPKVTYRILVTSFSCMYWDLIYRQWIKGGCKVVDPFIRNNGTMICECNHVSLFMGEIFPPSISEILNKDIDFSINFVENYVLVIFIGGLIFLWFVFLILAHMRDKAMKKKNVVYKLDDNVPGDSNPYLVVVFTGIFYDAHTTADVALKLVGDKAKSRTHLIKCQGATLLKRNSQDWLILYTPFYLGNIKRLKLWHNSKGIYPHWYCDRVIVQDLKVGEQYCFTVKKWFSVIWGTGRIYREFRLNRPSKKISTILFMTQFEKDMKDKHLWLSIVTRYFQSNFNCKERVSTGFCFLFLSMLANALLQGVPHNAPLDSIDRQNTFDINLRYVIIFIESWLAAIPLSFMAYFFFDNSEPL